MPRVAIFLTEGFREDELAFLRDSLEEAELRPTIVGQFTGQVLFGSSRRGTAVKVDFAFATLDPAALVGAIVPDGRWSDERLRDEDILHLLRGLHTTGRPIAALARGVRLLAASGICDGCNVSATELDRAMLEHAGAHCSDAPAVSNGHVMSARGSDGRAKLMSMFLPAVERFRQMPSLEFLREKHSPA